MHHAGPPKPGFYPAPHAGNQLRYWDGQRWHEQGPPPSTHVHQVPPRPRRGLGVAALIVGSIALVLSVLPGLGTVLALAALALGIVAFVRRQTKVLATIGITLSALALIISFIPTGPSGSTEAGNPAPAPSMSLDSAPADAQASDDMSTEPSTSREAEPPAPQQAARGTVNDPMPQPYIALGVFGGEKYSLTARVFEANANALVKKWNQFNDPAPQGFKYVVIELTMTGIDPDGVDPQLAAYDLSLATGEGNRYSAKMFLALGKGMPSMSDGPTLYPGSTFTGYQAFVVPEGSEHFLLYDNGNYIAF